MRDISLLMISMVLHCQSFGATMDEVVHATCDRLILNTEARIEREKAKVSEIKRLDTQLKTDFIYPTFLEAAARFQREVQVVERSLSKESLTLARQFYDRIRQVNEATELSEPLRDTLRIELSHSLGDELKRKLTQDLRKMGDPWQNGNRISVGSLSDGWSVFYAPAGSIAAGTITYVRHVDYKAGTAGGVSLRMEFRYDPFTGEFKGLPDGGDPKQIDRVFASALTPAVDRLDTSYYLWSSNQVGEHMAIVQALESQFNYRACKDHEAKSGGGK